MELLNLSIKNVNLFLREPLDYSDGRNEPSEGRVVPGLDRCRGLWLSEVHVWSMCEHFRIVAVVETGQVHLE